MWSFGKSLKLYIVCAKFWTEWAEPACQEKEKKLWHWLLSYFLFTYDVFFLIWWQWGPYLFFKEKWFRIFTLVLVKKSSSSRYSQLKMHSWCCWKLTAAGSDTDSKFSPGVNDPVVNRPFLIFTDLDEFYAVLDFLNNLRGLGVE